MLQDSSGAKPLARQYRALLATYLKPQGIRVSMLVVLILGSIGLQLLNPQIMRAFIDTAQAGGSAELLFRAALLFLAVAVVQQVVSVVAAYVSENVAWIATNALRADLAEHCLRLDLSFHNARTPGEMIERIDGDVTALSNFFSQFVIQVVGNGLLLAGVLILLFREDWRVGLALSAFSLVTMLILVRLRNIAVPHATAERQASAELFGFLEERLAGTEDIRSNGAKAYVMRHFYRLMRELLRTSLKAGMMINILLNAIFLLFALATALAFAVGAWLFYEEVLTIGTVYLIFHYTSMLERPLRQITRQLEDLQKATAAIIRIEELFGLRSRVRDEGAEARLPAGPLAVLFEGVSFGYDDSGPGGGPAGEETEREMVLRNLTFRLEPGTVLGLLGRTGSGKTTLTRLLFRFYDPDRGMLGLGSNGQVTDLRRVPLADVRQRVGMVTQNIQLFHASVRDNLTFFDDRIPDATIVQVLEDVGLGEWLQALPEGLDTVLESSGGGLSAGEAQLLAFIRIFLQDPGLVILDEASSRLDPATEYLIERAVDRLVQGRTAIIIAHRLGTVQRADEIMILEQGHIAEYGPRPALAADPGSRFYRLLQTGMEEVLV
jgi:ABC-type multidrug transport system fused ATPase/permease subunit